MGIPFDEPQDEYVPLVIWQAQECALERLDLHVMSNPLVGERLIARRIHQSVDGRGGFPA